MSELADETPETFCCQTMTLAHSFDGPFYRYRYAGLPVSGITVYKLTPSKKGISNAADVRRNLTVNFCPFCGERM